MKIKKNIAIVFGLYETGLTIGHSLHKKKIKVFGISYAKDIGYYSNKINSVLFSHPIENPTKLKSELSQFCAQFKEKPVVFFASDEYLRFYINNQKFFLELFLCTLSEGLLIDKIQDKYQQYNLAKKVTIPVPRTFFFDPQENLLFPKDFEFPVFIKARDVNLWRREINNTKKGFVIETLDELQENIKLFKKKKVPVIIQEIIQGPDTNNCKCCVFINNSNEIELSFTMAKIHQIPIHFGVASSAISVENATLKELGERLFTAIGYKGVGSAEFKLDERDGVYKLIEINTRYWQQNALADFCGMNFPYYDYCCATGQNLPQKTTHLINRKYVNIFSSFQSYQQYKKVKELTFNNWLKQLKGKKTISFLYFNDLNVLYRALIYKQIYPYIVKVKKTLFGDSKLLK